MAKKGKTRERPVGTNDQKGKKSAHDPSARRTLDFGANDIVKKSPRSERIYLAGVFLIMVSSFAIRYKGVWFGYPLPVHPDEPTLVNTALAMTKTGDLNPHYFNYPSLNIYLLAMLYQAIILLKKVFSDALRIPLIDFYIWGRVFVVFISTATIYVTYKIGQHLIHPLAGLVSACFIGASFLHIANSFTVTVDSSVAFWSSLACLMAVFIYKKEGKRLYYVLSGLFVGFAVSSKYTAFVCLLPMVIAHILVARKDHKWINLNILLGLMVVGIAFLLTTPYAVLDYTTFLEAVKYEGRHYQIGHEGSESPTATSFVLYFNGLLREGYGLFPMILSGGGLLWLLIKDFWKGIMILSFPLALFIFVGQYRVYFLRNIVGVIPFLSLLSGIFVYAIFQWLGEMTSKWIRPSWRMAVPSVVTIFLVLGGLYAPLGRANDYIHRVTLPDSRWASIQWIKENLSPGSRIGREHYTPPVERYSNQYRVVYLGLCALTNQFEKVRSLDLDYIILSDGDYGRFLRSPGRYPQQASVYKTFFVRNRLVKEFVPDEKTLGGPKISIYAVTRGSPEL